MDIENLLKNDNYVIILDTNVLLNVYRYSPDFSEFALKCLMEVSNYIYLPATVKMEYEKHHKSEFSKMKKRIAEASKGTETQIELAKNKILRSCDGLERLHFPDINELREVLSEKLNAVQQAFNDFFEDRPSLNLAQDFWAGTDHLLKLIQEIDNANQILSSPSQKDIFDWCDEGEKRYKEETPPGFKDAKNKDGVRKYSDLIIWMEVFRFAKTKGKNIILVTDDVKSDWWENVGGKKCFHSELRKEFLKTRQKIIAMTSQDLYAEISQAYNVAQTDAVEIALQMTDEDYCQKIAKSVFTEVESDLMYNAMYYINGETNIGSEGIDEFEIIEYEFVKAERVDRNDYIVTYEFSYRVTLEGTSFEFCSRDEDTGEIIKSYGIDHVFEGDIIVQVERETERFLDFEDDNSFETAEIISGYLEETEYSDRMEEPGELGYCPDCGNPLNIENDGGNGFCIACAWDH